MVNLVGINFNDFAIACSIYSETYTEFIIIIYSRYNV